MKRCKDKSIKLRHDRGLAALFFLLLAGSSGGQQPIALVQTEIVVFSGEFARPVQSPVKCDSEGNAYIRPYSPFTSPLLRLSWDGKVTSFLVTSAPGFEKARPSDFAVSPGGDVYELVAPDLDQTFLLRFTKDAQYSSKITLTPSLEPQQLAMFSEGSIFVSGFEWPPLADRGKRTLKLTSKPFTAIYDVSGRLVKRLSLPTEAPTKDKASAAPDPRAAISLASAVTGPDDNIYYLRRTANPTVFVMSSSGEIVRTVNIAAPEKGFEPETIKVTAGVIVVQFSRDNPQAQRTDSLYVLADWQSGKQLAVYTAPIEVGFAFACYTPDGFTFLTTRDKKMAIARAVPH